MRLQKKAFLYFALFTHFWIMVNGSIVKPTVKSLFLSSFLPEVFPYAWLFVIPLNLVVIGCYNRWIAHCGCFRFFLVIALITATSHTLAPCLIGASKYFSFFLYVWTDIYMMLMLHLLWSVIHSSMELDRAKKTYGFFFAVGTCGALLGNFLGSSLAVSWGSAQLLLLTLPVYFLVGIGYLRVLFLSDLKDPSRPIETTTKEGFKNLQLMFRSRTLKLILASVVFMQVAATLFDYQFSTFLDREIPDQDVRTAFQSNLFFFVNLASFGLQTFVAFFMVNRIGMKKSQLLLPAVLLLNTIGCLFDPRFFMISYAFSVVKIFDYSLFTLLKEMLYVPLSRKEKFKARAIIDVFAYRSSKAIASLTIISLPTFFSSGRKGIWVLFFLYCGWLATIYLLYYRERKEQQEESSLFALEKRASSLET